MNKIGFVCGQICSLIYQCILFYLYILNDSKILKAYLSLIIPLLFSIIY